MSKPERILSGKIVLPSGRATLPGFCVRAVRRSDGEIVAEGPSSRHGLFHLPMHSWEVRDVDLEILGESGDVLKRARPSPRSVLHQVTLPRSALGPHDEPIALLRRQPAEAMLGRAQALVDRGEFEPAMIAALADLLRPFAWLDALAAEADEVLAGDAGAADRFRAAFLGILDESTGESDQSFACADLPRFEGEPLLDRPAIVALMGAAVAAGRTPRERELLLAGLAAQLGATRLLSWVAQLLGEWPPAMRPLMLQPAPPSMPDFGELFGPSGPDLPRPKLPSPKDFDWLFPKVKINGLLGKNKIGLDWTIGPELTCFDTGRAEMAAMANGAPRWDVRSIDKPRACAGEFITLLGSGFGWAAGEVLFRSAAGGTVAAQLLAWTDTAVMVVVPATAIAGEIRLRILIGQVRVCGLPHDVYRGGESKAAFEGGAAAILSLSTPGQVEPGQPFSVSFATNAGPGSQARLRLFDGATLLNDLAGLPGGAHSFSFTAPATSNVRTLTAVVTASGGCGDPVEQTRTIEVRKHPDLKIRGVEVVQAIQRFRVPAPQNDVKLCARRRTAVRVYLDSGLTGEFDYGAGPNNLPGIGGVARVRRNGVLVATVNAANAPIVSRPWFLTSRADETHSVNFLLPSGEMFDTITIDVHISCTGPAASTDPVHEARYQALHMGTQASFVERPRRSLMSVFVRDGVNNLPAPPPAEYARNLGRAESHNPIPENGFDQFFMAGFTNVVTSRDLRTEDGWKGLLDDIEEVADDHDDQNIIWAAIVPANPFPPVAGMPRNPNSYWAGGLTRKKQFVEVLGITLSDVPPVMAFSAGTNDVFSHEMGHCWGFSHANCADPGGSIALEGIDPTQPPRTEEVGFDTYVFPPVAIMSNRGELMSYCDAGSRWPSIVYWDRMFTI